MRPARRCGVDRLREGTEPDAAFLQSCHRLDEVRQAAAEPIQLPNNEDVSVARIVQRLLQAGPIGTRPRSAVFEHLGASCDGKRIELQCWVQARARRARERAVGMRNDTSKRRLLSIADAYDNLAKRAEDLAQLSDKPDYDRSD